MIAAVSGFPHSHMTQNQPRRINAALKGFSLTANLRFRNSPVDLVVPVKGLLHPSPESLQNRRRGPVCSSNGP